MTTAAPHPAEPDTAEVRRLADEYRSAAAPLLERRRHGEPLSLAPYRFIAIHAVELYLNALLRHQGVDDDAIRALGHDLAARLQLAADKGLKLKKLTIRHLETLTRTNEYVETRYRPLALATPSHLNRLQATLDEVAHKCAAALDRPPRR